MKSIIIYSPLILINRILQSMCRILKEITIDMAISGWVVKGIKESWISTIFSIKKRKKKGHNELVF